MVAEGNKAGEKQLKGTESEIKNKGLLNTARAHLAKKKLFAKFSVCQERKEHLHNCTSAVKGHHLQTK